MIYLQVHKELNNDRPKTCIMLLKCGKTWVNEKMHLHLPNSVYCLYIDIGFVVMVMNKQCKVNIPKLFPIGPIIDDLQVYTFQLHQVAAALHCH